MTPARTFVNNSLLGIKVGFCAVKMPPCFVCFRFPKLLQFLFAFYVYRYFSVLLLLLSASWGWIEMSLGAFASIIDININPKDEQLKYFSYFSATTTAANIVCWN
jgi:hypothetical protein